MGKSVGRSYFRHTVYHTVDNMDRNKRLNEAFKKSARETAIKTIQKGNLSLAERKKIVTDLATNNFRYGRKYKYSCNLSSYEIDQLIRELNDHELYNDYFGKTMEEVSKERRIALAIILCIIAVAFAFVLLIVSR